MSTGARGTTWGSGKLTGFEAFMAGHLATMRERADLLADSGALAAGECWRKAAEGLDAAFRAWWLEELPVTEAAVECGYSPESLREMVRDGRVPAQREGNGGVRVRRRDLPRKPVRGTPPALAAVAARLGIR